MRGFDNASDTRAAVVRASIPDIRRKAKISGVNAPGAQLRDRALEKIAEKIKKRPDKKYRAVSVGR